MNPRRYTRQGKVNSAAGGGPLRGPEAIRVSRENLRCVIRVRDALTELSGVLFTIFLATSAAWSQEGTGLAPHQSHMEPAMKDRTPYQLPVRGPLPGVSVAPTAAFDSHGTLWLVWVEGSHVYVSGSADEGRTFALATSVNPQPESIDANGESRPKIAFGRRGEIFITYTRKRLKPYSGDIRFSRSVDGGKSFSSPTTINDDGLETGHRFDALGVSPSGDVYVFWIDKRDLERATAERRPYQGAALYYAVSSEAGSRFTPNRRLKDNVCECCHLALAFGPDGFPVLFWRDILKGGIRDHSILSFIGANKPGLIRRATFDDWAINGCPHHGPSLAVSDGVFHLAWFTGSGRRGAGTFYSRSVDEGKSFTEPRKLGSPDAVGRPNLLALGQKVFMIWKEAVSPAGRTNVRVSASSDGGFAWSPSSQVAQAEAESDHPFLVATGSRIFLSWFDSRGGYRLIRIANAGG